MKKLLSMTLVILVAVALAACGSSEDKCKDMPGTDGSACNAECACNTGLDCTAGTCQAPCTLGEEGCGCDNGTCTGALECCSDDMCMATCCCPGQALHITVDGMAVDLALQSGVANAAVAALAPLTALSGDIATHVAETSADANGVFSFACFDVSTVSLGLVLLADDAGFDGAAGSYFPTISGIAGYSDNTDKVCEEGAKAMAINNTLQAGLDQIPGLDKTAVGYIIGAVVDASRAPLAGATVTKDDGTALDAVLYPNADFSDLTGTETSATGLYIIPTELTLTALIGNKAGYTWDMGTFKAATVPGAAYFVPLVANE